jgi:hypothetical protein
MTSTSTGRRAARFRAVARGFLGDRRRQVEPGVTGQFQHFQRRVGGENPML